MELKTFSCFDNFVPSNNFGVPHHEPIYHAITHIQLLLSHVIKNEIKSFEADVSFDKDIENNTSESSSDCKNKKNQYFVTDIVNHIDLIGFSKGCVVLNQIITELYNYSKIPDSFSQQLDFFKKVCTEVLRLKSFKMKKNLF